MFPFSREKSGKPSSAEILKQCLCTAGTGTAAVGADCPVYQAM